MGIKVGTRYTLAEKAKFKRVILAYKKDNPEATVREIGRIFNVSHARVWVILKEDALNS